MKREELVYLEEKIDLVLQRLDEQQKLLELFIPDLRQKKYVATFLGITEQCLGNWITDSDSPMEEGIHYRINARNEIEFIAASIISLKRAGGFKNRRQSKNISQYETRPTNPTTFKIMKKIGKMALREEAPIGDIL